MMERVPLRDLELTRLALGCAPIGGLFEAVGEDQARATVAAARAAGVRTFDTAPLYGYGTSEHRLGLALAGCPRDEFVISTKVGRLLVARDGGVCARYDLPIAAAAMAFPARHPAVRCVVVGARSPEEMAVDAELFARPVPEGLWAELADDGLIRST